MNHPTGLMDNSQWHFVPTPSSVNQPNLDSGGRNYQIGMNHPTGLMDNSQWHFVPTPSSVNQPNLDSGGRNYQIGMNHPTGLMDNSQWHFVPTPSSVNQPNLDSGGRNYQIGMNHPTGLMDNSQWHFVPTPSSVNQPNLDSGGRNYQIGMNHPTGLMDNSQWHFVPTPSSVNQPNLDSGGRNYQIGSNHPTGVMDDFQRLYEPHPSLEFKPPLKKKKCPPYTGMAQYLKEFADPSHPDYGRQMERSETPAQSMARAHQLKLEEGKKRVSVELEKYDPENDPNISGDPTKTLFVARLNYVTTESTIKRVFEACGPIKQVHLVKDKETNKSRGYAFIEYLHRRHMEAARKQADGWILDNTRVIVDIERGRTVPDWRPRRLGGGLGTARIGAEEARKTDDDFVAKMAADGRKPQIRWRLKVLDGEDELEYVDVHEYVYYLFGRDIKTADIPLYHCSCSTEHAVLHYREITLEQQNGTSVTLVRPCIMDLDSKHGTFINDERATGFQYYELLANDTLRFGRSSFVRLNISSEIHL